MWNADPRQQWDFVFFEKRGYTLPVNSEVLDTLDFDADTTRETLAKNDPKCRRVLDQKRWFERAAIIFFQECVTWRSTSNLNCIKKAWQLFFEHEKNLEITHSNRKSFRIQIDYLETNVSKSRDILQKIA